MYEPRTFIDKLFLVLKGLGMGAANKVPGVSGGIVAFVGGFYEEFIYSLQKINLKAIKLLFNGRFKSFYRYVNGQFLTLLIPSPCIVKRWLTNAVATPTTPFKLALTSIFTHSSVNR